METAFANTSVVYVVERYPDMGSTVFWGISFHPTVDHAWEMEDKDLTVEGA